MSRDWDKRKKRKRRKAYLKRLKAQTKAKGKTPALAQTQPA